MRRGEKKGQFYLISALIIITIIISIVTVMNFAPQGKPVRVYDLSDELGIESEQVLEYGVTNTDVTLDTLLKDFTEKYSQYLQQDDRQVYFIFGNANTLYIATYEQVVTGTVTIGDSTFEITQNTFIQQVTDAQGEEIVVKIGGNEYRFSLKPGQNFYYIISQKIGGEEVVAVAE